MLMPYAASFTKAGVSPEEIEEAKQMLETDAWIRLDQVGSDWIDGGGMAYGPVWR